MTIKSPQQPVRPGGGQLPPGLEAQNNPTSCNSTDPTVPGVAGTNGTVAVSFSAAGLGTGVGVFGNGDIGVQGMSASGAGVWASGKPAGYFEGDVTITGDITAVNTITVQKDIVLTGADCAEQFDAYDAKSAEPGTTVVIDDNGKLRESHGAYDKRVAGVISGAGEYRPAIVLDRRSSAEGRVSVALVGKVYCKVDADSAPIIVGDLLTTSGRPGFAMKAADPTRAFGAVIGKALKPLPAGQGLIPILVALQ